MSLINSMLRDLDARKSDKTGVSPFENHVRVVPPHAPVNVRNWLLLAVGGGLLMTGAVIGSRMLHGVSAGDAPRSVSAPKIPITDIITALNTPTLAAAVPPAIGITAPNITVPVASVAEATKSVATISFARKDDSKSLSEERMPPKKQAHAESLTGTLAPAPASTPAASVMPVKLAVEQEPQQRANTKDARASAQLAQSHSNAVLEGLKQAVQMSVRHDGAREAVISQLINQGQTDEAMAYAIEGLNDNIAQPALAMTLARLQLAKGQTKPAIATLQMSASYAGVSSEYHAFLAALLQRDEQHKEAVEQYEAALQKTPNAGIWLMGLAISYQALQRNSEAQDAFRRAKSSNALTPDLVAFVDTRLAQLQH